MAGGNVLQEMRAIFSDDSLKLSLGLIKELFLAQDRSFLKVKCLLLPHDLEIIATMTWDAVGPNSGNITFPVVDDLVLIGFTENEEKAFVLKRLTSQTDTIPEQAITGDSVFQSLAGKKLWVSSATRINLSKGSGDPTENIVLGQVFKTFASSLLSEIKTHLAAHKVETHIGNLGVKTSPPDKATDYETVETNIDDLKSSPIDDSLILSDLAFTEKGS